MKIVNFFFKMKEENFTNSNSVIKLNSIHTILVFKINNVSFFIGRTFGHELQQQIKKKKEKIINIM